MTAGRRSPLFHETSLAGHTSWKLPASSRARFHPTNPQTSILQSRLGSSSRRVMTRGRDHILGVESINPTLLSFIASEFHTFCSFKPWYQSYSHFRRQATSKIPQNHCNIWCLLTHTSLRPGELSGSRSARVVVVVTVVLGDVTGGRVGPEGWDRPTRGPSQTQWHTSRTAANNNENNRMCLSWIQQHTCRTFAPKLAKLPTLRQNTKNNTIWDNTSFPEDLKSSKFPVNSLRLWKIKTK